MPSAPALHVLVVDDEPLARQRLHDLLSKRPGVERIATASNGDEAVAALRASSPDLAFLDVQMPGRSGLEVVRAVGPAQMPVTIFVTAYDRYALNAFELAALDYLLKPFDDERFEQAFQRALERVHLQQKGQVADRLAKLLQDEPLDPEAEAASASYLERIAVDTPGRLRIVSVADIDYLTADGSYVELHVEGHAYVIRERMKTLEKRLDPEVFFRIHRSTIVRLDRIASLLHRSGGDYAAELEDGTRLKVSRSRRPKLEERLGLL